MAGEIWHGNGHDVNSNTNGIGMLNSEKRRVKGRKRNERPWISLPLLAFFAFVVGCSYVSMGGVHDHRHHFHSAVHSVHAAFGAMSPDKALPKNLRHAPRVDRRRNLVQAIGKQQKPMERTHRVLDSQHIDTTTLKSDEDEHLIKVNAKERLIKLDQMKNTEQVRKEKEVLLNQIRKKQRAGLKKIPPRSIEKEITEKMNALPVAEKGKLESGMPVFDTRSRGRFSADAESLIDF